jgi:hypothetical protein
MNRAQAIEALRRMGFEARERTLSLGDSIFVGAAPFEDGGIREYRVGTYIYANKNGSAIVVTHACQR